MSGIFDQIINYSPPLIVSGTVNYKGTWNASTNNPTLNSSPAASTKGDYYVVSTAGTQFGITFAIGDWIISNGTAWEKVDLTDAVSSVFGRTGAVVGVSTDYSAVGLTNTAIGASNPSTGAFTTVTASSTIAATGAVTGSNLSGTNTGDQTTITGNAGSATVLQTARAIYGNNFDGSAALTQAISGTYGGTGVNNGANTITLAGNVTHAGAFTQSFTATANTSLTLPVTGTLATLAGSEALSNKTITASAFNGTVGATTPSTGRFTTVRLDNTDVLTWGGAYGAGIPSILGSTGAGELQFRPTGSTNGTVATLTSTGLNSTAIGATTPSTVSATTIAATSGYTANQAANTVTNGFLAVAVGGAINGGMFHDGTGLVLRENAVNIVKVTGSTGLAVTGALSSTGILSGPGFKASKTTATSGLVKIQDEGANVYNVIGSRNNADSAALPLVFQGTNFDFVGAVAVTGALSATGQITQTVTSADAIIKQASSGGSGTNWYLTSRTGGNWTLSSETRANVLSISNTNHVFYSSNAEVGQFSSTGLAVTGTSGANGSVYSGNVNFAVSSGTTDGSYITNAGKLVASANGDDSLRLRRRSSDGSTALFYRDTTNVGNISVTTVATTFNSLSDYRRKSNVQDLTGSGEFIDALKPRTFDWDSGDKGVGFIAHEFAEVSPSSVAGEKDAIDSDGKPLYQTMQASSAEVIANLVAELQSVRQRLAALEA